MMEAAPQEPSSQSPPARPVFSIPRAVVVLALSLAFYAMDSDIVVVKWKVQRHAAPDAWPFTFFRYACLVQIAATILLMIGSSSLARAFRVSPRFQAAFRWCYRLLSGVMVIAWYMLMNAIARG